jgi:NAD+ diphosphatase
LTAASGPGGLSSRLPYNGLALDRAAGRRGDPAWVAGLLARPESSVLPFWQDKCLVTGMPPVPVSLSGPAWDGADSPVLLGLDGAAGNAGAAGAAGVFAADLSELSRDAAMALAGASDAVDVRRLFRRPDAPLDLPQAAVLGYARGILRWHRRQRFCGACGAPAVSALAGAMRVCTGRSCAAELFPRLEPAVIMLVEAPGEDREPRRCLLVRRRGAAAGQYALVAGFAELGESLEDAARRETAEETGIRIGAVTYQGSQAWPFPSGLMVGFRAAAISAEISVDPAELAEARWCGADEVAALMTGSRDGTGSTGTTGDSIEGFLVRDWLAETG